MKIIDNSKKQTAPNRIVNASPPLAARVRSARSVATLAPTPPSPTLPAPQCFALLYRGLATSVTTRTLGEIIFELNEKFTKNS